MVMHRRDWLSGLAGGIAASASWSQGLQRALAIEPTRREGTINDVQHVVILTQENRSFDHYLGTLRGVRGFGDPRAAPLPGGQRVFEQPAGRERLWPFHLDTRRTAAQCLGDIHHAWKDSHTLWKDWDAWVRVKGRMSLGHFRRADLPYYHALADAFTVCDAYYCSVFGPTNPNRMFLMTGTSGLSVGDRGAQVVSNVDDGNYTADMARDDPRFKGYRWRTYAERLQAAGVRWQVYQEYDNYGDNALASFRAFRALDPDDPLYARGRDWVAGSHAGNASSSRGEHLVAALARDVAQGTLPQVSWLVGPFITTEHPDAPPAYGESFVSRVLDALTADPDTWSRTVLLINFDENGGFFDHQPSPLPAISRSLGLSTVDTADEDYRGVPMGLGVRVPMLVVSPWTRGGWVNSQVFDHGSVLQFLERRFGVPAPELGLWRRTVCGDLTSAFDFALPDPGRPALPDTSDFMRRADRSCRLERPRPPASGRRPRQEPGQRPARALPYRLSVLGQADEAHGRYQLRFDNLGAAGTAFIVYAANRSDGPWHYTVQAGGSLADSWAAVADTQDAYDLEVHGPNGWLRQFRGRLGRPGPRAQPELGVTEQAQALRIELRNTGNADCVVTLRALLYADPAPQSWPLPAGGQVLIDWPLASSDHWYDLVLSSSHDRRWLRRLAGHVETGLPSRSDPAFG